MAAAGTQLADAVWLIKNGATPCASVQIENAAVGTSILWTNTLNASEWLRFTSQTQRVELSTDSGSNWTKVNQYITSGKVPKIQGGVDNDYTITGPTTGTHSITYTAVG